MAYQSKYKGMEVEAMLDGLSGKADKLKRVEWSGRRVAKPNVKQNSVTDPDGIDLATDAQGKEFFVARIGTEYYGNWYFKNEGTYADGWQEGLGAAAKFLPDVLYVSGTEELVASPDRNSLVHVSNGVNARVWVFKGIGKLTTSSTASDIAKILGVAKPMDLQKLMKTHVFVDVDGDESTGDCVYRPCLVEYDYYNEYITIAVDSMTSRKIIAINSLNTVSSVSELNLRMPTPVNNLTSSSTTLPLSANMGRMLSLDVNTLKSWKNTTESWKTDIDTWKNKMPELVCVPIRELAKGQATPEESKVEIGEMAIYWISGPSGVSTPTFGLRENNNLGMRNRQVTMENGEKFTLSVGGKNSYADTFKVKNAQGTDVTNSYRLWGIVFGTR